MWSKLFKILAIVIVLCFWGLLITYKISLPAAEDLPRQMKNGAMVFHQLDVLTKNVYSYTEPDHAFANHHWFYGVIVFLLYSVIGWSGLVIFKIIFLLCLLLLLLYVASRKADFWLVLLFTVPTIIMLSARSALRPEIFTYFFIVLYLWFLLYLEKNPQTKIIYWLIPLQLLWVNIHLLFGIGILMITGFLVEKIILVKSDSFLQKFSYHGLREIKNNPVIKKLAIVLTGTIIVSFLSPYGIAGAIFSLRVNANRDFPVSSQETQSIATFLKTAPIESNYSIVLLEPMLVILALSFIAALLYRYKKKQNILDGNFIFYFFATAGSGVLSFFVIRAIPLFALMFLPAISTNLDGLFGEFKQWLLGKTQTHKQVGMLATALLICMIVYPTSVYVSKSLSGVEIGVGLAHNSEAAAKFWLDNKLQGPIFNDTDIGSYLIYYLYPKEKVFSDNRFGDAYSASFFSDIFLPMVNDDTKWKEGVSKYNINAIFWYQYDRGIGTRQFLYRRSRDPDWVMVYADSYSVIFLKRVPENQNVINKFAITRDNAIDKLAALYNANNVDDQIAAADLFDLLGRTDLALVQYMKVLSLWPYRSRVWMVVGQTLLSSADQKAQNPVLAALFLERAISQGWKTPEAYSYLALAYYRTGQSDRTRAAVDQELKIDPENIDGQKWLGILANDAQRK